MSNKLYAEICTIDPATNCWIEKKIVVVEDQEAMKEAIKVEEIELFITYDLDESDLERLNSLYEIRLTDFHCHVTVVFSDNQKMFSIDTHTGRELYLMIAGKKPLSAFVEEFPKVENDDYSHEEYFDKFYESFGITKRSYIHKSKIGDFRRILYAARHEEWRIDAYISLWTLTDKYGWNDGFEKLEGFLLGYYTDIDPFFVGAPSIKKEGDSSNPEGPHSIK